MDNKLISLNGKLFTQISGIVKNSVEFVTATITPITSSIGIITLFMDKVIIGLQSKNIKITKNGTFLIEDIDYTLSKNLHSQDIDITFLGNTIIVGSDVIVIHFSKSHYVVNIINSINVVNNITDAMLIKNGLLYNYYAIKSPKNLANIGWHIPTIVEWEDMRDYIGYEQSGKLKETGTTYWSAPNTNATNATKFNARPSGRRNWDGEFMDMPYQGWWWTLNISPESNIAVYITASDDIIHSGGLTEVNGISLRLVKDLVENKPDGTTGLYTGNDGKVYRTICINGKEWLADNLAETMYQDKSLVPKVTDNTIWATISDMCCAFNNDDNNI